MNAKRKGAAVSGISGLSGILDEPWRKSEEEKPSLVRARACSHLGIAGVGGVSGDTSIYPIEKEGESLAPAKDFALEPAGASRSHPPTASPSARPADVVELTDFVALWADLPIPSSLEVHTTSGERAWFTASRRRAQDTRSRHEAVFVPAEYEALCVGALEQRITHGDVEGWVRRKRDVPDWMLDARLAVAEAFSLVHQLGDPRAQRWRVRPELLHGVTWSRALDALGLTLVRVVLEDVVSSAEDDAAAQAALGVM